MAFLLEQAAQRLVVIEFAVEDDPHRAVLVRYRLVAGRNVDDAEPPIPQPNPSSHIKSVAVWSPMGEHVRHPLERGLLDGGVWIVNATDSAHITHRQRVGTASPNGCRGTDGKRPCRDPSAAGRGRLQSRTSKPSRSAEAFRERQRQFRPGRRGLTAESYGGSAAAPRRPSWWGIQGSMLPLFSGFVLCW